MNEITLEAVLRDILYQMSRAEGKKVTDIANCFIAEYLNEPCFALPVSRLNELVKADKEERCVILPCKVGDTIFVLDKCEKVLVCGDDDYFTEIDRESCPFEYSCKFKECKSENVRIFETLATDFWFGEANGIHPEIFVEDIQEGYLNSDFGKKIFLTREEAEKAMKEREQNEI